MFVVEATPSEFWVIFSNMATGKWSRKHLAFRFVLSSEPTSVIQYESDVKPLLDTETHGHNSDAVGTLLQLHEWRPHSYKKLIVAENCLLPNISKNNVPLKLDHRPESYPRIWTEK
jgi:hypothetical protein